MSKEEKKSDASLEWVCLSEASLEGLDQATQSAMTLLDECKIQCCALRAARISRQFEQYNQREGLADKLNRSYLELGFVVQALIGTKTRMH